jgi:peptide/nickel transport system substrate-binding protein
VEIQYIASWSTRRDAFIAGNIDICAVPRANMPELLDPITKEPAYPSIETIKYLPKTSIDGAFFTFTIDPASAFIGSGSFPNGIPTDFFNNTHVRRAFACAFNYSDDINGAYGGEALRRSTPLIWGLYPEYHTGIAGYDTNLTLAEEELKKAIFDGTSVWESGFTLAIPVIADGGGSARRWADDLHDSFASLSTYDGRPAAWPDFVVNVVTIDSWSWSEALQDFMLPMWAIGWWLDFTDADNTMFPYMHSYGDFSYFQNYSTANGWGTRKDELLDLGIKTPDGSARAAIYSELEQIYVSDSPSIPFAQPLNRRWTKYWVRGWYYNPIYFADYYYILWKEDVCWYDIAGLQAPGQPGISDGASNIKDITYLILRFNAKPPDPAVPLDPKWVGTYGNGGVDTHGDRICNIKSITYTVLHFNHGSGKP